MTPSPRVLVVGAGSIGRRHAALLVRRGAAVDVADPDPERAHAVEGARVTAGLDGSETYDGIVVATPTILHGAQVSRSASLATHVLVEKPLTIDLAEASALASSPFAERVAVAYNLRFHEPVQRLVETVRSGAVGEILGGCLWFGSYLPDWRPAVDYRSTYSARSELGGGVVFDAIHELDLAVWLFGAATEVVGSAVARVGGLEIDVEDTAKAVLRAPSGALVDVSLDYLSRRYRRGIEVIGSEATARLDWARAVLEVEDADSRSEETVDTPLAQSYERQVDAFLAWIDGGPPMPVGLDVASASVRLASEIRATAS